MEKELNSVITPEGEIKIVDGFTIREQNRRISIAFLEVGQEFDKKAFIESHWGYSDYFKNRTFDVSFCKAKKLMPEKNFKTKDRVITRIK